MKMNLTTTATKSRCPNGQKSNEIMAADSDQTLSFRRIRVTEKELEMSSNVVNEATQNSSERSKRYSRSRAEACSSNPGTSVDRPLSGDSKQKAKTDGAASRDSPSKDVDQMKQINCSSQKFVKTERFEKTGNDHINDSTDINAPKSNEKPRKIRKGYEVYQIKRGKYSEKININESEFQRQEKGKENKKEEQVRKQFSSNKDRKHSPKGVKIRNYSEESKTDGKWESTDSNAAQQSENWDSENLEIKEPISGLSYAEENWDKEAPSVDENAEGKVNSDIKEKSYQLEESVESSSKTSPNTKENVTENASPNTKDNVVENEYKNANLHVKNELAENKIEESNKDKSLLQNKDNKSGSGDPSKEGDGKLEKEKIANRSIEKNRIHSSREQNPQRAVKRGIGRGRKNKPPSNISQVGVKGLSKKGEQAAETTDKSDIISKQTKDDSQLLEKSTKQREKSQESQQKTAVVKQISGENVSSDKAVKRKVKFSDDQSIETCNENVNDSDSSSNKSRTAGILVLPSPISEGNRIPENATREDMEPKPHTQAVKRENGFSKLKKPSNFDPSQPRGDAKFRKENNQPLLVRKKDMRISSSDAKIWDRINSECAELKKLLSGNLTSIDDIEKILELSTLLQDLYKELIVKHLEFSFKNDIEGSLWKNTFHNIITAFRSILNEQETSPFLNEAFQFYWNFLQDGDDFLKDLLSLIEEECKFNLQSFVNNPLKMANCKKNQKLGIRSCHLILLNLGDLERYITDLQQETNYAKANENYIKARALAPKNGKSYNQLAVVAVKSKRKLDAIYYYIRSLEASNPIESARERLTGIFHEIKRKADLTKKQSLEKSLSFAEAAKRAEIATEEEENFKSDYSREDIWVFFRGGKYFKAKIAPNGKIQELSDANTKQNDNGDSTEKVSLREANKEFLIYYLYMQSKLYTRIGFEHIMTVYEDAMQPFKVLLKHEKASSVKKLNLIKYMAINIFAVNNLFRKQEYNMTVIKDSPLDVAIIFGMDMSARIAEHCFYLIENNELTVLEQFLPALHAWMKWMPGHLDLIKASSVCYMNDIWESYMKFLNTIRSYEVEDVEKIEDGEPVGLFEDMFLSGFSPLLDMENPSIKVTEEKKAKAEAYLRAESLKELAFMISDSHKLPVIFNDERSVFEVVLPETTFDSPTKNRNVLLLEESVNYEEDIDSDVIIEDVIEDIDDRELQQLKALKAKKMELISKFVDQEKREQERAAIMENNASQVHIISENHPKFIVPDTNCFIDNLEGIVKIIESRDFNIRLPLIVMNELDGLKKGRDFEGNNSNTVYVKERARLAVEMLENRFSDNDKQLKALTSAGTELETIAFRDEELSSDKGKNDDIILSCCLHYCEEATNRLTSGGGPLLVQRNVVLLTDDRNLRLKAHSRHVPTLSIKMFLKMAHLA